MGEDELLLGIWRYMVPLPPHVWHKQISVRSQGTEHLAFMSKEHHQVRDFAVRELPRFAKPLSPGLIAERLGLPLERVVAILDELEKHMTFLFRDEQGNVTWAYPVTVARTPHRVTFSSGEQLYAA